ncbi:uncharacterized protein Dana_GF16468 [Drosophila ananassae]|uniref:Uncharacterized protein n=1 Tax=Drosophila ananassae TaxID=7217 RepID=B3M395_DROAN|nr:uncharacterized protein LOC6499264 [Drosophila ananassae]EDV43556.1 uncharacterized protein Dana_GF16468 [Drosophila ananassae]
MTSEWEKTYHRLVRENENDEWRLELLERQVRHFKTKRQRIQNQIELEKKDMDVWVDLMEHLKLEAKRYKQEKKHQLTPKKKKQLENLLKRLPHDKFAERVRLMEVSENLLSIPCPKKKRTKKPTELPKSDPCDSDVPLPKKCDPNLQSSVDRKIKKINNGIKTLRKINEETLGVISDIRALKATINYLERGQCTNMKITPYVDPRTALKTINPAPEKKATIALDRLRVTKNRKYYTREILDIRPPFILENVPQLMPKMYDFLDQNRAETGKRKR